MNSKVVPAYMCACALRRASRHSSDDELDTNGRDLKAPAGVTPKSVPSPTPCTHLRQRRSCCCNRDALSHSDESLALLQLKVRSLDKYKTNYELLCSQLEELNAQIGLQLEQHEADVTTLNATIATLQRANHDLERALRESQALLASQQQVVEQDRAYSERVHAQLSTAAELLKATEKRIESKEQELVAQVAALKTQLAAVTHDNDALQQQTAQLQDQLRVSESASTTALRDAQHKHEKLKIKSRQQLAALRSELDTLASELESQRALTRSAKKQASHYAAERDALAKQLSAVKGDVESLASLLERQKESACHYEQKLLRCKKQLKQSESAAQRATQQIDRLQSELLAATEALVRQNTRAEALQTELRALKTQCALHERELREAHSKTETLAAQVAGFEAQQAAERERMDAHERARVRTHRKELEHMRQLLAVNHERASESSKDVLALKQELLGVQELLHSYRSRQDSWRQDLCDDTNEQQQQHAERCAANRAEASVLKRAIMEQVAAAAAAVATDVHSAPARVRSTSTRRQTK